MVDDIGNGVPNTGGRSANNGVGGRTDGAGGGVVSGATPQGRRSGITQHVDRRAHGVQLTAIDGIGTGCVDSASDHIGDDSVGRIDTGGGDAGATSNGQAIGVDGGIACRYAGYDQIRVGGDLDFGTVLGDGNVVTGRPSGRAAGGDVGDSGTRDGSRAARHLGGCSVPTLSGCFSHAVQLAAVDGIGAVCGNTAGCHVGDGALAANASNAHGAGRCGTCKAAESNGANRGARGVNNRISCAG